MTLSTPRTTPRFRMGSSCSTQNLELETQDYSVLSPHHLEGSVAMSEHDAQVTPAEDKAVRSEPHPRVPIRRFDIFAEYNRQKAIEDGIAPDEALGYGLWLAKVVASRSFGRSMLSKSPSELREMGKEGEGEHPKSKWRSLDGKPQTDDLFEKEIVRRMGVDFYHKVFVLAIEQALAEGKSYQSIRDTLRKGWTV